MKARWEECKLAHESTRLDENDNANCQVSSLRRQDNVSRALAAAMISDMQLNSHIGAAHDETPVA